MDTTNTVIANFIELFRGRGDVYGAWEGGCVRRQLTPETFERHLKGEELIGVYPIVPRQGSHVCVWGCSDIDVDDLDSARNLQTALKLKDITSWVEKTARGYHVWVFADTLVPAAIMRRALLAAHQAIRYPAKEVNPKQEELKGGVGNYVRLPYPNGLENLPANRFILDDEDQPLSLEKFVNSAILFRTTLNKLENVARLYKEAERKVVTVGTETPELRKVFTKMTAIPYVIWRDGPTPGADRSSTLFKLASFLKNDGLTPDETLVVVRSADTRWGKFHQRNNGEKELLNIVEKVYGS